MWKLTIEDDEGKQTGLPLAHEEYALGRGESNSIRLTDRNVSRQHATLCKNGQGWVIKDLDSYNGTYVNGVRVTGEQHLRHGDLVQLGDYRIELLDESLTSQALNPTPAPGKTTTLQPLHTRPNRLVMVVGPTPGAEFPLDGERFTIGRSEDATISINHSSVSRLHAELISLGNGRYEVVDKQSANGVRINGVELKRGLLEAGDALELGDVRLRFVGAGKIFRAGPDGTHHSGVGTGTYESVAPSVRAPPLSSGTFASGPRKLMGALVAIGVLLIVVLLALARSGPSVPAYPTAAPASAPEGDADTRVLETAKELFHKGDVEGAHKMLQAIAETSPARDSQIFKDIEERWANDQFQQVEKATSPADKLSLLNVIASTASVPPALRSKAAEMIAQIDLAEPGPQAQRHVAPEGPAQFSSGALPHAGGPVTAPAPSNSSDGSMAPLDSSGYAALRTKLEPKVWGGKATIQEIKMLRAVCSAQSDRACRDRANAILQQRQP